MSSILFHGDCLEVMKDIPSDSIDLVVTSPPYDNLRTYNGSLDWSFEVFKLIAMELSRCLKIGGVIVWVAGDSTTKGSESGSSFRQALYFKDSCKLNLHDTMIYAKEGAPLSHNRYEQKFEYMFVLSKGKPKTFNGLRTASIYAGKSRKSNTMRQDSDSLGKRSAKGVVGETKLKGNIWEYAVGYGKSTMDKIAYEHPAIFPELLAKDHILSWSNEGDTVLDCFMGSGTTGKMALTLNRKFIGIEKEETYFKIAQERIAAASHVDTTEESNKYP